MAAGLQKMLKHVSTTSFDQKLYYLKYREGGGGLKKYCASTLKNDWFYCFLGGGGGGVET